MIRKTFFNLFTIFVLLSVSLTFTTGTAIAAQSSTVTLDIPGMTCKFCPITIKKALKKVPGVISAEADYETKTATISYDPDKTSTEALIKATTDAGYPSTLKQ